MRRRRQNSVSLTEEARRARQRRESLAAVEQLLYTRRQTAHALGGISIATIQRLERAGKLTPIRLVGSENGVVFHRVAEVRALAAAAVAEAAE